jgi:hypothetical protein
MGESSSQLASSLSKFDLGIRHSCASKETIEINSNSLHKKAHQVRFITEQKDGKAPSVKLADSEESIISDSTYDRYAPGYFEHVRMVTKKFNF